MELLNDNVETERSEEELDKLADDSDKARNAERPMSEKEVPEAKADKSKIEEYFEFDHGGKKIKGTREQLLKWAQMGYDRPQAMQKFNQEKAQWDQSRQKWEQDWGIYKQIDEHARSNKEWWDFVQSQWQNRANPQQPTQAAPQGSDPYAQKFQTLEQKLSQFEPTLQKFQEMIVSEKQKQEDHALDQEIQSIREQYKDLDWEAPDENGKSLELRILEHAQETGIRSFKTAFRDLLHDQLVGRAESQAKIAVAKGIQQKTKLGVLGESPTPQKWQPRGNKNLRTTSYEELEQEIRDELQAGRK